MHNDDLLIPDPCHADWTRMSGDSKRRFCNACTQHVHDLSAMTKPEAEATLAREAEPCIRYDTDAKGQIVFLSRRRMLRRAATAAVAATLLATPAAAASLPASDDSLLARLATRLELWLYGSETPAPTPQPDLRESELVDTAEPPPPPRHLMGKPKAPPARMGKVAPDASGWGNPYPGTLKALPPPPDQ